MMTVYPGVHASPHVGVFLLLGMMFFREEIFMGECMGNQAQYHSNAMACSSCLVSQEPYVLQHPICNHTKKGNTNGISGRMCADMAAGQHGTLPSVSGMSPSRVNKMPGHTPPSEVHVLYRGRVET